MQGEVLINYWKVALEGSVFDPKLGIGRVMSGSDGPPICLIWIHVYDFFLHGPTRANCTSALKKSHGGVEVEVEVEVVELLNGWTQGMDPSQICKPGWGLGMELFTASLPTGESSEP
jgi:hypothetical protein